MNTRTILSIPLSLLLLLATIADSATAQTAPGQPGGFAELQSDLTSQPADGRSSGERIEGLIQPLAGNPLARAGRQHRELAEDTEILARILEGNLEQLYAGEGTTDLTLRSAKSADGDFLELAELAFSTAKKKPSPRSDRITQPLAAHLDGYGIIYQLAAPPLRKPSKPATATESPKCPFMSKSEWERARMILRGEAPAAFCMKCHTAPGKAVGGMGMGGMGMGMGRDMGMGMGGMGGGMMGGMGGMGMGYGAMGGESEMDGEYGGGYGTMGAAPSRSEPPAPTEDQLVDRLLTLLAENGHNVRHLKSDERLTIAVTFRENQSEKTRRTSPGAPGYPGMPGGDDSGYPGESGYDGPAGMRMPGMGPMGPGGYGPSGAGAAMPGGGLPGTGFGTPGGEPGAGTGMMPGDAGMMPGMGGASANHELAGDLHMRQRAYAKAIEAYEKSLEKTLGMDPYGPLQLPLRPQEKRLLQKLAQAQIAAGNLEKAHLVVSSLLKDQKQAGAGRPGGGSKRPVEPPQSIRLPARLTVSVTKAQLDAVAAQKMTFDQFKQQARIEDFDGERALPKAATASGTDPAPRPGGTK